MPSLRKRVSTYFRQLSFHNEPRQRKNNINENAFITKYLQGHICLKDGPPIIYGKNPSDLPNYELAKYDTGYESIISCYSGPHGGLTTVKRIEKHLSIPDADDFDFIDTQVENVQPRFPIKSSNRTPGQPVDNTKMVIKVAGQEYFVKNDTKKHRKSLSLGSISDFNIEIEKTKIDKECCLKNSNANMDLNNIGEKSDKHNRNKNDDTRELNKDKIEDKTAVRSQKEARRKQNRDSTKPDKDVVKYRPPKARRSVARNESQNRQSTHSNSSQKNFELGKSKSEGNPFRHKGIRKVVERPKCATAASQSCPNDDSKLPQEWMKKNDYVFGISDSLYDTNLVTKVKNGDPIADCFGVISRKDSVILAVADGVNWGEKACIAAKSAIHGCLHYLNKTIFNDSKLFENLVVRSDQQAATSTNTEPLTHISNTREVFICLLRAFNCAHDLILENNGMLTTLTVAIVLPLSLSQREGVPGEEQKFVCCVCNVGDTLAYIYSGKYGVRELTKGSHDITSNRDMRDALGALGPVDGINPELSNLTLSITTLNKGDIVMVASDGLTDNFDPSVCRFTVNTTKINAADNKESAKIAQTTEKLPTSFNSTASNRPVKPPRRSHLNREDRADSEESKSSRKSEENTQNLISTNENIKKEPKKEEDLMNNPLIAHFIKQNSVDESDRKSGKAPEISFDKTNNTRKQASAQKTSSSQGAKSSQNKSQTNQRPQQNYNFLRSKTTIDFHSTSKKPILRNAEGIPYVTPVQRYELQLLLMEDILKHGISGQEPPCTTSKRLCENLVNYTISITAAKRRTLEDMDLYFDNRDGVSVEISAMEKKQRRKKGLEKVTNLPGKLDHVTVVACNVAHSPVDIQEH